MSNLSPLDPSSLTNKKKKSALPAFLSSLRNAQAVIGRAADDFHERETRPLAGGASGSGGGGNIKLNRSAPPSASLSSALNNFSQRVGSQLRKHKQNTGRRKKGHGVTGVPQSFYVAVVCFFFAFPILFVIYILARHAVFGDETDNSVEKVHIHEVPPAFAIESEIKGEGGVYQPPTMEAVENSQVIKEKFSPAVAQSATTELQEEMNPVQGGINRNQTIRDISDKIEESAIDRHSSDNIHTATGGRDENGLALEKINSINDLKGDTQTLEQAAKDLDSSHSSSIGTPKKDASSVTSWNTTGKNAVKTMKKEDEYVHQLL